MTEVSTTTPTLKAFDNLPHFLQYDGKGSTDENVTEVIIDGPDWFKFKKALEATEAERAKRDRAMADARNRIAHEIEVQERFKVANRADSDKGIQKLAIMNEGAIMAYKHALSEIDAAALKEQERES